MIHGLLQLLLRTSEVEVVRAVLDGRADAGVIGSPFWNTVRNERLAPEGALREIWSSPACNHCMFMARPDFDHEQEHRFAEALSAISYDDPVHRPIPNRPERWSCAVKDSRQLIRVFASAFEGAADSREGLGESKDVVRNQ